MTKITIEIDTTLDGVTTSEPITEAKTRVQLAANKIGLLSTIDLTQSLSDAFWSAVNQSKEEQPKLGYKSSDISNGKKYLKNTKNCKVIATVGGTTAFTAVNGDNDTPFVSLMGFVPASINSQCGGGVSLESSPSLLRKYLVDNCGLNAPDIYLLTNNNSPFYQYESTDWNNPGTLLVSYICDGAGTNDATKFPWDWVGNGAAYPAKIPVTATGVIISDDPFFQANQSSWMSYADNWLGGNAAWRIIFPNKNYTPSGLHTNQMIVKGCDLVSAYRLLGALASSVSLNPNVNFGFIRLAW
jgi:hypothetical protein